MTSERSGFGTYIIKCSTSRKGFILTFLRQTMDDIIFDSNPDGAPAGLDERVAQLADPEWADDALVDDDVEQNSTPENTETFTESSQRLWRVDHSTGTYKYKGTLIKQPILQKANFYSPTVHRKGTRSKIRTNRCFEDAANPTHD